MEKSSFEEFERTWQDWGVEDTLILNESGTILSQTQFAQHERNFLDSLPSYLLESEDESSLLSTHSQDLKVLQFLGEGGMGTVFEAKQCSLKRSVAIKTLKNNTKTSVSAIIKEARITGGLEHPNIVPVHLLGKNEHNLPILVLKKISGQDWNTLLKEKRHDATLSFHDFLAWSLKVLIQLCNAVHFAHQHGVIHRDLKPENVMIGDFGEVYLLDWGVAFEKSRISEYRRELTGTPGYMAPEMVWGNPEEVTEQTDIYLLGAILHEILTGKPPHKGNELLEILFSATLSEKKSYSSDIPLELQDLCQTAMHYDPSARLASVVDFRERLEKFLHHRTLHDIHEKTRFEHSCLARLFAKHKAGEQTDIYEQYYRVRFGYENVIQMNSEHERAKAGLQQLYQEMCDFEMACEHLDGAMTFYGMLESPSSETKEKIEALQILVLQKKEKLKQFEQLRYNADMDVSRKQRNAFIATSTLPMIGFLMFSPRINFVSFTPRNLLLYMLLVFVFFFAMTMGFRTSFRKNQVNHQLVFGFWPLFLAGALIALGFHVKDVQLLLTFPFTSLFIGFFFIYLGIFVKRELALISLVSFFSFACMLRFPSYTFELIAGLYSFSMLLFALLMRNEDPWKEAAKL